MSDVVGSLAYVNVDHLVFAAVVLFVLVALFGVVLRQGSRDEVSRIRRSSASIGLLAVAFFILFLALALWFLVRASGG